jgi:hypothetical protein
LHIDKDTYYVGRYNIDTYSVSRYSIVKHEYYTMHIGIYTYYVNGSGIHLYLQIKIICIYSINPSLCTGTLDVEHVKIVNII